MEENENMHNGNENQHDNVIEMRPEEQRGGTGMNITDSMNEVKHAGDTAVMGLSSRTLVIISWISAAFAAFLSPYFGIIGIFAGVLSNRQVRGSGNAAIIANVIVAAINLLFGFYFVLSMRRMLFGF